MRELLTFMLGDNSERTATLETPVQVLLDSQSSTSLTLRATASGVNGF